jgi:hypothetical protein
LVSPTLLHDHATRGVLRGGLAPGSRLGLRHGPLGMSRRYGPPGLGLSYGPLLLRVQSPQFVLPLPALADQSESEGQDDDQ